MGRFTRVNKTITITPGVSATTATTGAVNLTNPLEPVGLPLNGLLSQIIYTVPASVDSSATMTISIIDQDGNTVWSKGSLSAGAGTTILNLTWNGTAGTTVQPVPLSGYYEIRVTYSTNQTTTASSTKVVLLLDEG